MKQLWERLCDRICGKRGVALWSYQKERIDDLFKIRSLVRECERDAHKIYTHLLWDVDVDAGQAEDLYQLMDLLQQASQKSFNILGDGRYGR